MQQCSSKRQKINSIQTGGTAICMITLTCHSTVLPKPDSPFSGNVMRVPFFHPGFMSILRISDIRSGRPAALCTVLLIFILRVLPLYSSSSVHGRLCSIGGSWRLCRCGMPVHNRTHTVSTWHDCMYCTPTWLDCDHCSGYYRMCTWQWLP